MPVGSKDCLYDHMRLPQIVIKKWAPNPSTPMQHNIQTTPTITSV
jgi:hypothetical protein